VSNSPPPTGPVNDVNEMIAALDGLRVPGGCDDCDAYQEVRARDGAPNLHTVRVFHDDGCPVLARIHPDGGRTP